MDDRAMRLMNLSDSFIGGEARLRLNCGAGSEGESGGLQLIQDVFADELMELSPVERATASPPSRRRAASVAAGRS